ncbi:MAG: hypothetical protein BA864_04535 [Desulfuromonadales bacterium C00003093]|nr:MAG: hypothetical protein BA864_04535 [Desulfuromonadales bacterium C00003093]
MSGEHKVNIRFYLVVIVLVLLTFLGGIFLGLALRTRTLLYEIILSEARSHFQSIVLTRAWNAEHGGVFVLKRAGMESNPYLENPDIITCDGQVYTKKNPALMTREITELIGPEAGMIFHITSLMPLNPNNRADDFETVALKTFEAGEKEKYLFTEQGGRPVLCYMAPLLTTEACLGCHGKQGYQIGDIRGGISVTLSVDDLEKKLKQNMVAIGTYGSGVTLALVIIIGLLIVRLVLLLNEARAEVEKLAVFDGLTNVFNRRHGMELLTIEINKAKRMGSSLCCLLVDLDHFKKVNDTYGHDAGDQALKAVAASLQGSLRGYDILFRYGGEEFVVIFPGLQLVDGELAAERIRQDVAELQIPIDNAGRTIQTTLSGGLCALREDENQSEKILKRTDNALYRAKDQGRNRIEK